MADNTQDVELRIRATNYSRKSTTEVTTALKELVKAEEAQIEASKRGAASAADLEKGYTKIESAVKALLGQSSLIKLFQSQSASLEELKTKLETARKAQADYAASLPAGQRMSAQQTAAFNKMGREAASVEKQIARMEGRIGTTTSNLKQFGIDTSNAASKQNEITAAVTAANAALARQEAALDAADGFAKQRRDADALLAQRQAQVRADVLFNNTTRQAAEALAAQARAEREVAAAAAMRNVQHEADMEALFTREANKRTAALNLQAAAMRAAADAAERQLRTSAATARGSSPVQVAPTIAQRLGDIANPNAGAIRTVQALDSAIGDLSARVAAINGPVRDYRASLQAAEQAQRSLAAMGGLIDSYQRQVAAVRAARAEYVQARTAVNELVAQMRAGAAGDDITTRLARAQSTLASSAAALGNITTQARGTRQALEQAGIQTNNLGAAEANLIQQANRAAGAMNGLTDAYRRNGAAADSAGSSIFRWFGGDGGRTTLSFAQRLRGEVLGLTASFIGLQATIGLARKTIEVYNAQSAIMARLTIVAGGDAKVAAQEFKYLEQQADRIGFVFTEVAPAYAKFSIAMKAAGFDTQQTRFAFENIAGSAVKARLSTDELTGILKAFEQMASKGKIQAEELRGQLGDRLPGAFQIAAKAAGKTVEEYTKMMELGQVGSDQVLAIARELGKTYGAAQQGAETLLVAQARFQNATNRFLTSVAEGGFVEAYQGLLNKLTQFMNDGSADKLAKALSQGFVLVIDIASKVADNLDLIATAIKVIIATKFLVWLGQLPALLALVRTEMILLNAAFGASAFINAASVVSAITAAMGAAGLAGAAARLGPLLGIVANGLAAIGRLIPLLGAAYVGYEIGTAIGNRIDDNMRKKVMQAQIASEKAYEDAAKARDELDKAGAAREIQNLLGQTEAVSKINQDATKQQVAEAQAKYDKLSKIAVDAAKKVTAATETANRFNVDLQPVAAAQKARATVAQAGSTATADPGDANTDPKKVLALKAELDKEARKIERQAQNQRLKAAKGDLAARLDLIDQEYDDRRQNVKEAIKGEKEQAEAIALINKASLAKQAVERAKYNNEQTKGAQSTADRRKKIALDVSTALADIESDLAKRAAKQDVTEPYEKRRLARVNDIGHAYDDLAKKIVAYANLDPKAAAAADAKLKVLIKQREVEEGINSDRAEAVRLEKEFNDLQDIQKTKLDAINTLYETGQIGIDERLRRTNEELAKTGPGIQAAGQKALQFAESVRSVMDPVVFERLLASIGSGVAKASVDASTATNTLAVNQEKLNSTLDAQAAAIDRISTMRKAGMINSETEANMLNQNADEYRQKILDLTTAMLQQLETMRAMGAVSEESYAKQKAGIEQLTLSTQNARVATSELDDLIANSLTTNATTAFEKLGNEIGKVATGAESIGDGFRNALSAVGEFFASLLRDIAMAIAKQLILNAIASYGGGVGAGAVKLGGVVAGNHNGGVVGRTRSFSRKVDPAIFAGAQRYHDGGLPGIRADEVPTILQKGEEVLRKSDPRNVMNGGTSGGGTSDPGQRFVLVDDRSKVAEAMQSAEGEKVTMIHLRRNVSTLKQLLK